MLWCLGGAERLVMASATDFAEFARECIRLACETKDEQIREQLNGATVDAACLGGRGQAEHCALIELENCCATRNERTAARLAVHAAIFATRI